MRTEIDKESDAGYIYFKDIKNGEVKKTISLNESINIDLDENGKILGIEIFNISKNLPKSGFSNFVSN